VLQVYLGRHEIALQALALSQIGYQGEGVFFVREQCEQMGEAGAQLFMLELAVQGVEDIVGRLVGFARGF
jgi:hypothetical protein